MDRRLARVLGLALIAGACGPAVRCSSNGGLEFVHAHPSFSYPLALFFSFIYLIAGPFLAVRAVDARVVAALPLIVNTAVASYAVSEVLRVLAHGGYVPETGAAIAAGLAEAILPWCVGAAVSAVTSLVIGLSGPLAGARARRTRLGSAALAIAIVAAVMVAGFVWYLRPGAGTYRAELERLAMIPFTFAALAGAVAVVSLAVPRAAAGNPDSGNRWFLAFAGASAAAACLLWIASDRWTDFAAGRI
jgi:hypothetical protein